jgi:CTP synthase
MLQAEGLDEKVCQLLHLDSRPADMERWKMIVHTIVHPSRRVKIAVVGKYVELQDAYKSIYEALCHAGGANDCGVDLEIVDAEQIEAEGAEIFLSGVAGILVPGGFGDRGTEGKIAAARFARENKIPYFGICLGMQIATIEFARNVCGLKGANSTEFDPNTPHPVIALLDDQKDVTGKGGSMRLGEWPAVLKPGSLAQRIYGQTHIAERHRHRYEFNGAYRAQMEEKGFVISGTSPDGSLVEIIEHRDHPWFVAVQFHPEFLSKPEAPHPLFDEFIRASIG